ncbi:hypothetical protein GLOIN_2v1778669 [Rhizophagus irregularis DAOM 181602=DAOM 197198]|nr:hypothetical protein GLOIN_2v1778669 [Rhizophagus irregularis DAOM 181602=DAOM 197198]
MRGTYEIVYSPEAKARLESLCELTCDTLIDPRYFYRLAHICQQIQGIVIINNNLNANHGTIKLIEFQKNLKYFEWVDDFTEFTEDYDYFDWEKLEDPYTEIFDILKNHANTLIHFEISLYFDYNYSTNYDYTFLQYALLELQNLKILEINSPRFLDIDDFNEKLEMVTYHACYEKGEALEFGDYLSNVLIREASTNLINIGIPYFDIEFSLETLEKFFEKWKGRPAVSLYFDNTYFYRKDNSYMKLFDKYKIEGVIKDINA